MLLHNELKGREKSVFLLMLVKNICASFRRGLEPQLITRERITELLKSETPQATEIMGDPVVKALMSQILAASPDYNELSTACGLVKDLRIGRLWASYASVCVSESGFQGALEEVGDEMLSRFIDITCGRNLSEIYELTFKRFNFLKGIEENFSPLYTVNLSGNFIHMIDYEINFNGDDNYEDVLITFDLDNLLRSVPAAIDFEIRKLSKFPMNGKGLPENTTHSNATYFTEVVITSNGWKMLSIPLTFEGFSHELQPADYSLEFRRQLADKGGSAYTLDLNNIKVLDASSSDLLKLSKSLPRSAARHLRGAALEDDLGM